MRIRIHARAPFRHCIFWSAPQWEIPPSVTSGDGKAQFGPHSPQNAILGDARRSTAELGKLAFDMTVDFAVKHIRSLLTSS
jgi:creatinine amidohydrolase/Fe(II)-dependent formamide hydrolase-like protein